MTHSPDPVCPPVPLPKFPAIRSAILPFAVLLSTAPVSRAVVLNLTDITVNGIPTTSYAGNDAQNHVGGFINGAVFQRSNPGSGSGQFRALFRMSDDNDADKTEHGYNRGGTMDSQTPNGFDPLLKVQDLVETTDGGFYTFALDANESNGGGNNYLSIDMFSIYVGGVTDPGTLPTTEANLGQLGTRVYTFSTNDTVLIDAGVSGSGAADLFVFVPKSLFTGFGPTSYVYVFASHGGYSAPGFDTASGFEEWASIKTVLPTYVPEPGSFGLAALSGILALTVRRRRSS